MPDPRTVLDDLILQNRDGYAAISKMLGRNAAYIQQFIKRGSPRALSECDRATLARYFNVEETSLGAPPHRFGATREKIEVSWLNPADLSSSSVRFDASNQGKQVEFNAKWLRKLTLSDGNKLSMFQITDDSMRPTLLSSDEVLLDRDDTQHRLRDGIYVIRFDDTLLARRIAVGPSKMVSIIVDSGSCPQWGIVDCEQIDIVGRVIWVGRYL